MDMDAFQMMSLEDQISWYVEHEEECELVLSPYGLQLTRVGAARLLPGDKEVDEREPCS